VNTSGDGFLAMFDGRQRAIHYATAVRDAVQALGVCTPVGTPASAKSAATTSVGSPCTSVRG
jgi:hypothetical protein